MTIYAIMLVVHVLSAVIWLGLLPTDYFFRGEIKKNKNLSGEKKLISLWLKISNISGMIGLTGVLVTGFFLTMQFGYGFFQFADGGGNHWLYTKQFLTVILILIIGILIIPTAKKLRIAIGSELESTNNLSEEVYSNFNKLKNLLTVMNILVLVNFLLALSRRFIA
ncbi:MAG: hypothetical protein C0425_07635 [Chlorobiaceae bacterium]|nr:hypothetical protein [Chlorobiaceae bacterium]MBA4310193.1 hypothetical protein [Chlorobiaceae bacterium]